MRSVSLLLCSKYLKMTQERKLPEGALEHDFIITDESLNRNGWRIIVTGIDLTGFLLNPVCCVEHDMRMIPIGKWKNLRIDGDKLKGTVEFDRNDPDAVKLYWKYKDGYMNAVSLHVLPVEESEDTSLLHPGQKYPTITKSEMLEISIVAVPGQKNAVKLSYIDGKEYKLHLLIKSTEMNKNEKTAEQMQTELDAQKKLNAENLIKLHQYRGVVSAAESGPLKELALSNYENVQKMLEAREVKEGKKGTGNPAEVLADNLVKLHFDRGAIGEPEKSVYRASAIADYEGTRKVLEAKPGKDALQSFVGGMQFGKESGIDDRAKWTYLDWYKKDLKGLSNMEKTDPEKYEKLASDFQASCSFGDMNGQI